MSRIVFMVAATLATFAFAAAQTPEQPASDDVDREFARISQGWKPTQRGKTTLYCRIETSLGTRVGRNVCLTRQQLYDRAQAGQEARDRMAKPNQCTGTCTTGS